MSPTADPTPTYWHNQFLHDLNFAVRTWFASMLALYIAYFLELDTPYWAWLTVWIVSQPNPGMVLSKGLYRFIGTVSGAVIGLILICLFAQTPEAFVFALAVIVALCTVISNLLRNFQAYATVLAAYTAGIVAAGAVEDPGQIFYIAFARASAISLGILCCVVVTALFAPHRCAQHARADLRKALAEASRRATLDWKMTEGERLNIGSRLIMNLIAMDTTVEFAVAESGDFRLQANNARSIIADLLAVVSAKRALDEHLQRTAFPDNPQLVHAYDQVMEALLTVPGKLDLDQLDSLIVHLSAARRNVTEIQPEMLDVSHESITSQRLIIDRLEDLLLAFEGALYDWRDVLQGNWHHEPRLVLNFHRDQRAAFINGIRAFVAVMATGLFWIYSAWPDGANALIFVCIMMSLFSSVPHPDRVGASFFKIGVVAAFVGLFCKFWVLPVNNTFEFLCLGIGIFVLPMGMFIANSRTSALATSFSLVFLNVVQPSNPMNYDLSAAINSTLALMIGILFGTIGYKLLFPPSAKAARRYVTHRIRLGVQLMAARHPTPTPNIWETRMYDRVQRLHDPLNPSATSTDEWLQAGLGALILGLEILRLRRLLANDLLSQQLKESIHAILKAFSQFLHSPHLAKAEVERQFAQLNDLDPGVAETDRISWARLLGSVGEMRDFLINHPALLSSKPTHV